MSWVRQVSDICVIGEAGLDFGVKDKAGVKDRCHIIVSLSHEKVLNSICYILFSLRMLMHML